MVGAEFLDYLSKLQIASYVGVEDFADKFNFLITVMVIMMCTSVVTVKQYMMKPISCYMATDIGGRNLLDYVENYCWVQGTIPIRFADQIPDNAQGWNAINDKKILYYQWVPFVLGLQCILFYLPSVIWRMICYNRTGTDVQHIVSSASQAVHSNEEQRAKLVMHLARTLEQLLFHTRDYRQGKIATARRKAFDWCNVLVISKRLGNRLYTTYIFIKILYLLNAVGQLFMMEAFLGIKNNTVGSFGYLIADNIKNGKDWETTQVFPRVGYCLVQIRQTAGPNYVTAQCVLPVNMLNERIYIFLWFWIVLTIIINCISIPIWFMRMLYEKSRVSFVKKFLRLGEELDKRDKIMVKKFCQKFLRHDGVFLLRMIQLNAGELICSDIVCKLWALYKKNYFHRDLTNDVIPPPENDGKAQETTTGNAITSRDPSSKMVMLRPSAPTLDIGEDMEPRRLQKHNQV